MKPVFFEKFKFSEIRKDLWQASVGGLSKQEIAWLKKRQLVYFLYRLTRSVVLLPVTTIRYAISLIQLLDEFERLHFSPLRQVRRGKDCVIDKQTWIINGQNIVLGNFVKISAFSSIMAGYVSTIRIGTNTIIGPGVVIVSFNHGTKMNGTPIRYQEWGDLAENSIFIGKDVWIGANVTVLPGTIIGDGAIIGAGTIVKGVISSGTIAHYKNGKLKIIKRE